MTSIGFLDVLGILFNSPRSHYESRTPSWAPHSQRLSQIIRLAEEDIEQYRTGHKTCSDVLYTASMYSCLGLATGSMCASSNRFYSAMHADVTVHPIIVGIIAGVACAAGDSFLRRQAMRCIEDYLEECKAEIGFE